MFENGGRGIGQKGKDNGALIVVALNERQVGIEVGYDLEEFITDGFAGETIRDVDARRSSGAANTARAAGRRDAASSTGSPRGAASSCRTCRADASRSHAPRAVQVPCPVILLVVDHHHDPVEPPATPRRRRWGGGPWSGWNSGVGPFGGGGFGGGFGGRRCGGFGGGGGGGLRRLRRRPERRGGASREAVVPCQG